MPKHIKKYKKRKKPIRFNPDGTVRTNLWNKELTVPQQILFYSIAGILVIGILLVIAYFVGDYKYKSQGYETSDLVVKNYIDGIETADNNKLRNCFSLYTLNNETLYNQQVDIAKNNAIHKTKIDADSLTITSSPYSVEDIINNLRNPYITNANLVDASFKSSASNDYLNCQQFSYYKLITYEFESEWYVYAAQKIHEVTDSASHKKTNQSINIIENSEVNLLDVQKVGSKDVGYVLIDKQWQENQAALIDELSSIKSYTNTDGTAIITLATTTSYDSLADLTAHITQNMLDQNPDIAINDVFRTETDFCGYTAVQMFYLTESNTHNMTWLFKTNESDKEIHLISYDYTSQNSNFVNYVYTFTES